MTKYNVRISLEFKTDVVVDASDVYEANAKAEDLAAGLYSVYDSDSDQNYSFHSITGYDPEEIA
jgi:hypothetical protein